MSGADEPGGQATDESVGDQSAAFAVLADPALHGGPVARFDTHGAVVFAGPSDVYKIKRAVRLPYMDLSTVALRRAACAAEVAINRAYAPDLYRGVVAIVRRGAGSPWRRRRTRRPAPSTTPSTCAASTSGRRSITSPSGATSTAP